MRTIPGLLHRASETHGDRSWLRTDEGDLSFTEAVARIGGIASWFRERGTGHGDLVLMTARNEPRYLLSLLAVTTIGAIAVPINPQSSVAELTGLFVQLKAADRTGLVVTDPGIADQLRQATDEAGSAMSMVNISELENSQPAKLPTDGVNETDVAIMVQTSGTTGRSKLVKQTHRAHVLTGEGFPHWMEFSAEDCLMTSLPLFHTNAVAYSTMGSLTCGAGLVLLSRFSASRFLDSARRHGATSFNAVGGILEILMEQPVRSDDADTPLRTCYTAPAPSKEHQLAIEERFGIRLVCGYGMSESMYGTIWLPGTRPYGTLGWPRQHPTLGEINEARVADDGGRDVDVGSSGELLLRNPTVTPGYYDMPDETAAALDGGWLHTGDLVTVNGDGSYTFHSRKKEVIRKRGENLAPAEVEQTLSDHHAVLECAVIGVPAGLSEEEVKVYIKRRTGSQVSMGELSEWTADRLAAFKVPRFWQFVEEIPHTATGRIAKHRLPSAEQGEEYDLMSTSRSGAQQ